LLQSLLLLIQVNTCPLFLPSPQVEEGRISVPTDSSTITILVLDVFAFFAVLAYASFESRRKLRKQRRALVKTHLDGKPRQNSVKPKT
jgi:hypothetical protein